MKTFQYDVEGNRIKIECPSQEIAEGVINTLYPNLESTLIQE